MERETFWSCCRSDGYVVQLLPDSTRLTAKKIGRGPVFSECTQFAATEVPGTVVNKSCPTHLKWDKATKSDSCQQISKDCEPVLFTT